MKKCCLGICLLGIMFGLSSCGGSKFEKAVPDEVAATDFWNDFYSEDGDYESVNYHYFWDTETEEFEKEFTVLARGMVGEDVDFTDVDLMDIEDAVELETNLEDSYYNWILAKAVLSDDYKSCQIYVALVYGESEFYYEGYEKLKTICKPIAPHPADYYDTTVQFQLDEAGVVLSEVTAASEQTAEYDNASETVVYDYNVVYRGQEGIMHITLGWNEDGFDVIHYECSEELQAKLPPKGAYLAEECKKDQIYVLRDGYFYPIYNLPAEEYLYDDNGNAEEKVAAVHVPDKHIYGVIKGLTEKVPIYPDDKFVIFKGNDYKEHLFLTKVKVPDSKKYINLDYEFSPGRMLKSVMNIKVDSTSYEVAEVNGVEVKGEDWAKQTLFKNRYYVGEKNDQLNIGAYRQTEYFEFEIMPDYRVLEANESTISIDYERTKNGYGVFDCSGMKGLYVESDYDCLLYFQ